MPANVAAVRGPGNHLRPAGCRCLSKAPPLEEPGSPFPPIADYAFLSDCHTGALLAPDGTIEWLCVPRFDAPERLRRRCSTAAPAASGSGRTAIGVPGARRYEPGTNILETTWMTPTGWVVVRDALTHRAVARARATRSRRTRARRPTTTPTTCSCARSSASRARSQIELICEPMFDYGAHAGATWSRRPEATSDRPTRPTATTTRAPDQRPAARASRATARGRGTRCTRARSASARCRGRRELRRAAHGRRGDGDARPRRRTSGAAGSTTATSPTIAGAATCSARRSC